MILLDSSFIHRLHIGIDLVLSQPNCGRIEMVKLDSGVHSGESPVNGCSGLVSFCLQGRDLATQSLFIGNTPGRMAKTLTRSLPC